MNHEIMMYGIAQKEQLGFDKAVEECKYRESSAQPDAIRDQLTLFVAHRHVTLRRLAKRTLRRSSNPHTHANRCNWSVLLRR